MSIGSRLRQLRKANNLSGDKLGELCGVTKGMVSQWESGDTTPPTDRLLALHKHLKFSFDWLLSGEDNETTYSTSDPTLVEILKVLEPRNDYLKTAAFKAVVTTVDLVEHATHPRDPEATAPPGVIHNTISVSERRLKKAKTLSFVDRRKAEGNG
jgi:transcriptional regulator with XRE-family HTH domain